MPTTRIFPALITAFVACLALSSMLSAQQGSSKIIMVNVTNPGAITITAPSGNIPVGNRNAVPAGASITTAGGASLTLLFSNGSSVLVKPNTVLNIDNYTQTNPAGGGKGYNEERELGTSQTRLRINRGDIVGSTKTLNLGAGSSFEIATPVGIAGIRGTDWFVQVVQIATGVFETILGVTEGSIEFNPADNSGTIQLPGGQQVQITVTQDAQGTAQLTVSTPASVPEEVRNEVDRAVTEINQQLVQNEVAFEPSSTTKDDGLSRPDIEPDDETEDDVTPEAGLNSSNLQQ